MYAIVCFDRPDSAALRDQHRAAHLEFLNLHSKNIVFGGPLKSVADINYSEGPSSIKRYDRYRVVALGADLPIGVALDTASARFKQIAAEADLPATVEFLESGDAEVQAEMQQSFGEAMLLGLMMVLVVLILLFKDVIQPFTILFSLPLAIGGVAAALILTQNALSMPVLIGILMLMGIVTKNSILLVEYAVVGIQERGLTMGEALVDQLVSKSRVKSVADLYDLTAERLMELDRMGKKSADNLVAAIEESKSRGLARLLNALSIRHVGTRVATILADRFGSMDALQQATEEQLSKVNEIGPTIAKSVYEFLNNDFGKDAIHRLAEVGVSQTVLETLMLLYRRTGDRKYLEPIPVALAYLKKSVLPDGRLARYARLAVPASGPMADCRDAAPPDACASG